MVELSAASPSLWRQGFAGDVFNTLWYARAALDEGWEVRFHTAVGTDRLSDEMVDFAEAAGIRCRDVPRLPGRSPGLYAIHLDQGERTFTYWRETSAARQMMADPEPVRALIHSADVTYLSGITLAILPPGDAEALVEMLAEARSRGRLVAFDPNIRPRLWADAEAMRDLITRTATACSLVLPSFDDEAAAFGDATPLDTARRYLALGCGTVVVKDGARPTTLAEGGMLRTYPVMRQGRVVDTTAAGDSFNGAYLGHFLTTGDAEGAVRAAQLVAARVVGAPGALVP